MNVFKRFLIKAAVRFLDVMRHPTQGGWGWTLPGTRINYARAIGKGLDTNVFMAPILYVARNWGSAVLAVRKFSKGALQEFDQTHPMCKLIRRPNKFYSGVILWFGTLLSWFLDGNAYWLKVRGSNGQPGELWYVPHWMMEPKGDENTFITHYEYSPEGQTVKIDPSSVVHLRFGMDPENIRKGYSQMKAVFREAYMDHEASNLISALLFNRGVPGIVISPDGDYEVAEDDKKAMKDYIQDRFTGDHRGEPLVLGAKTKVDTFGFNPTELNIDGPHNLAEERVCSMIGLPASVVGFGSGMEQTKVGATAEELKTLAWTDCMNPNMDMMADQLTEQLLKDFAPDESDEVAFDRSGVGALQANRKELAETLSSAIAGMWMQVAEAREAFGLEVNEADKVYLRSAAVYPVDPEGNEVFGLPDPNAPVLPPPQPASTPPQDDSSVEDLADDAADPENTDEEDEGKGVKRAPRLTATQRRILRAMDRAKRASIKMFKQSLIGFFESFGAALETAWLQVGKSAKADEDDAEIIGRIEELFQGAHVEAHEAKLSQIFSTHYAAIHTAGSDILARAGLVTDAPDIVAQEVMGLGAMRAELVNLSKAGKQRAFTILAEAREDGAGIAEVARALREHIPAGPWATVQTRAEVVARTEVRIAQNYSSLNNYRHTEGVQMVRMLDNRLGPQPEPDLDMAGNPCAEINGMVVTFEQAEQLIMDEHPNGTRDMVPVFEEN